MPLSWHGETLRMQGQGWKKRDTENRFHWASFTRTLKEMGPLDSSMDTAGWHWALKAQRCFTGCH